MQRLSVFDRREGTNRSGNRLANESPSRSGGPLSRNTGSPAKPRSRQNCSGFDFKRSAGASFNLNFGNTEFLQADQPGATEDQPASDQLKQRDIFVEDKPACRENHDVADSRKRKRPAEVELCQHMHPDDEASHLSADGGYHPRRRSYVMNPCPA